MSTDKRIKELEASIKKMKHDNARTFGDYSVRHDKKHIFLIFFSGLFLLLIGLFYIFITIPISISFISVIFGNLFISIFLAMSPFLTGILLSFFCKRKITGFIVTIVGVIILILNIVSSIRINFVQISVFKYIVMFVLIAAGSGLVINSILKRK